LSAFVPPTRYFYLDKLDYFNGSDIRQNYDLYDTHRHQYRQNGLWCLSRVGQV